MRLPRAGLMIEADSDRARRHGPRIDRSNLMDAVYIIKRMAEIHVSTLRAQRCPSCSFFERVKRL